MVVFKHTLPLLALIVLQKKKNCRTRKRLKYIQLNKTTTNYYRLYGFSIFTLFIQVHLRSLISQLESFPRTPLHLIQS